jgi:preprotein translocase subunit Sss1
MDPATIALATSAFALVRKGFQAGREIESMTKDLSRWLGACHDIERSHNKAKTRRWGRTVEEEALETWTAMRQVRKDRETLRLYMLSVDPNAWNQLVRLEGQIRKQRQLEEEARQKRREEITIWLVSLAAGLLVIGMIAFVVSRLPQ